MHPILKQRPLEIKTKTIVQIGVTKMPELTLSEFSQKGEDIYNTKILPRISLEDLKGKIMAIDVDTGDYFIESSVVKAITLAQKKYPAKKFYLKRIGYRAVHSHKGIVKQEG
jgi:hypothetical protein